MDKQTQNAIVAARVPPSLKQMIGKFIHRDTHINESDFLRDAIREKIQRDAPDLYRQLFREVAT
jgi:Arc/MetJ-type ribon-helix-helix transcriptional regulator